MNSYLQIIIVILVLCIIVFFGCGKRHSPEIKMLENSSGVTIPSDYKIYFCYKPGTFAFEDVKLYSVANAKEDVMLFAEINNKIILVNKKDDLTAFNKLFERYEFSRSDFNDINKRYEFLSNLTLYSCNECVILNSTFSHSFMKNDLLELFGIEERVEEFKKMVMEPQFTFNDKNWFAEFNIFNKRGGVEHWKVIGVNDSEKNINQIEEIQIKKLKKDGTFSWPPMVG